MFVKRVFQFRGKPTKAITEGRGLANGGENSESSSELHVCGLVGFVEVDEERLKLDEVWCRSCFKPGDCPHLYTI